MRALGSDLKDGDVILTNHPAAGGKLQRPKLPLYVARFRQPST